MNSLGKYFPELVKPLTQSFLAIVIGLAIGALFIVISGYNPLTGFYYLFKGAFFTETGLASTLSYATILMLVAITFGLGMRAGLFNIGAEGQLQIGALAAVAASIFSLPPGLHLLVGIIFAMLAGALWSLPAAIFKVKKGVHEVLSTIMLNWIAFYFCLYMVVGPLLNPEKSAITIQVQPSSRFPLLFGNLSAAIFVAILIAIIVYFIMWHTRLGSKIRAVGFDQESARYMGISPGRVMMIGFLIGGMAAGLAGGILVMGMPPSYAIIINLSNIVGYGFMGIAVALIGRNHPLGMVFAAVFFGGLWSGKRAMQLSAGIPVEVVSAILGIIVVSAAIPGLLDIIRRKIRGRSTR